MHIWSLYSSLFVLCFVASVSFLNSVVKYRETGEEIVNSIQLSTHPIHKYLNNALIIKTAEVDKNGLLNEVFSHPDNITINYDKIEREIINSLLNGYGKDKDKYIIHKASDSSGLGNQVRSLVGNIAVALSLGRRFRILPCNIFTVTNSSLYKLLITQEQVESLGESHYYNMSNTKSTEYKQMLQNKTFAETFPHHLIIHTNKHTSALLQGIPNANTRLKELGLLAIGNRHYPLLYRLVLQPTDEIRTSVFSILKKYDMKRCIGIQMRTGGSLANTNEEAQFLTDDQVRQHAANINQQYTMNEFVYISTDSEKAIDIVKQQMTNHTVITADQFSIAHSSLGKDAIVEGCKRGLLDAIVASHCNALYLTDWSSFGELIRFLTYSLNYKHLKCNYPFQK